MQFSEVFSGKKPIVIACIHLLPLPGAPRFDGNLDAVYTHALSEAEVFKTHGVDGLIIENFRDVPFYPGSAPPETVAAISAIAREVTVFFQGPVGINVLRNDGVAAMAVASVTGAKFIRVNVHTGAAVTDQGIVQGEAYKVLRLRRFLQSRVLVFADVHVKHAAPLAPRGIEVETRDLAERGLADAVIVSGSRTGSAVDVEQLKAVRNATDLPILIGSGVVPENIHRLTPLCDGFIVGSYFKKDGLADNLLDTPRVKTFMNALKAFR